MDSVLAGVEIDVEFGAKEVVVLFAERVFDVVEWLFVGEVFGVFGLDAEDSLVGAVPHDFGGDSIGGDFVVDEGVHFDVEENELRFGNAHFAVDHAVYQKYYHVAFAVHARVADFAQIHTVLLELSEQHNGLQVSAGNVEDAVIVAARADQQKLSRRVENDDFPESVVHRNAVLQLALVRVNLDRFADGHDDAVFVQRHQIASQVKRVFQIHRNVRQVDFV